MLCTGGRPKWLGNWLDKKHLEDARWASRQRDMKLAEEYRFSHEICFIVFREHKLQTTNGRAGGRL